MGSGLSQAKRRPRQATISPKRHHRRCGAITVAERQEAAADSHPEVAARRAELLGGAIETLHTLVRACAQRGWLGGPLTEEERVATLYTVGTLGSVSLVMRDLGLQQKAYQSWMRRSVERALFGAGPRRPPATEVIRATHRPHAASRRGHAC